MFRTQGHNSHEKVTWLVRLTDYYIYIFRFLSYCDFSCCMKLWECGRLKKMRMKWVCIKWGKNQGENYSKTCEKEKWKQNKKRVQGLSDSLAPHCFALWWWYLYNCTSPAHGWPSPKQLLANKLITLPLCPQWQMTVEFNSGVMLLCNELTVAWPLSAVTTKLQAAFTDHSGKVLSGSLQARK